MEFFDIMQNSLEEGKNSIKAVEHVFGNTIKESELNTHHGKEIMQKLKIILSNLNEVLILFKEEDKIQSKHSDA